MSNRLAIVIARVFTVFILTPCFYPGFAQDKFELDSNLYGKWISENYINEVIKTKDPYNAFRVSPYKELEIKNTDRYNDTLKILISEQSTSEHSGFQHYIIISEKRFDYIGQSYFNQELSYSESDAHFIYSDKESQVLELKRQDGAIDRFVKIPDLNCDYSISNLEKWLGNIILKGSYNSEKGTNIEFKEDGIVHGIPPYKYYNVGLYYAFSHSLIRTTYIDFSQHEFKRPVKPGTFDRFSFSFESDTLKLYELAEDITNNHKNYYFYRGDLEYKFIKNNSF